ncbi:YwmB family TATA-box binding protein [Paenibacillus alvei]|uniref:YwmB family TATA-box binding protein n=1 Tax=Paenibacillus alvei TaxID=44250 RepID=UPI001F5088E6|nr:YwmB family TATA-box binding protein [Paenibacillus alvei]
MMHAVRRSVVATVGLVLLAFCGAIAIIGSSDQWQWTGGNGTDANIDLVKRVNMLWVLAELVGSKKARTTVLIQGNYAAGGNLEKKIEQWQKDTGITVQLIQKQEQGKNVYRGKFVSDSIEEAVLWFQEDDGRAYYTISIQGSARTGMTQAAAEGERIMKMVPARYGAEWTATIQTITSHSLKDSFERTERALQEWGKAEPLDRYEDERTISISYQTDYMGAGVQMKQGTANLQLAIHENRDKGETRISFGTPLIAGEY